MNVAFINENALGHSSYLPRFVAQFRARPELGIVPFPLDVTPMPPDVQRRADRTIRGLRKVGLDFHVARWRRVASAHARVRLLAMASTHTFDAVVVNTQSVGLDLVDALPGVPLYVGLDATFRQLSASRWFAMNRVAGWLLPLTLAPIRAWERRLFGAARRLFPWSEPVRESLEKDYGMARERISVLPPSLDLTALKPEVRAANERPQILFLGGDFWRKGGPILLDAFRRNWRGRAELHVITQSRIEPEEGVFVHRGVPAQSEAWFERWRKADVFVFPSELETFGIVLLEALAFRVPVIASRVGAAADVLEDGAHGILLDGVTAGTISGALAAVFKDPALARRRSDTGRARVESDFDLARNTERMAEWLRGG